MDRPGSRPERQDRQGARAGVIKFFGDQLAGQASTAEGAADM
jgi:hypothetical protein